MSEWIVGFLVALPALITLVIGLILIFAPKNGDW
jgi:UPF0716 family protein affecting phage T7 exclusion